jgi:hypothetical protein
MSYERKDVAMNNDVEKAEKILAALRGKRDAAVAHGIELGEQRTRLAFDAHTGNKAARERLDALNREGAVHASELHSLDCAISEAAARVKTAQAAESAAAAKQKAEEARAHVDELAKVFQYTEQHLMAALQGLIAIERGVAELHQKGVAFPTDVQLRLGIVAVIGTFLQQLPRTWWNEISAGLRYRAPAERKTAASYWTQLEPSLQNAICQAAGEPRSEEAA